MLFMTKQEFINQLSVGLNLSKTETDNTVTKIFKTIAEILTKDDEINLPSFGRFAVSHKTARTGRNPSTGKALNIPAKAVPVFKSSTALKELIATKVKPTVKASDKKKK